MNKKSIIMGLLLLLAGGILIVPKAVMAYKGNPSVKGPNYTEERHTAMTKAFENNDYNAWKELMQGKGRVTQAINAQNFSKFSQAHKLALEGKTEEANKIRAELGLGQKNGFGMGMGRDCGR